MLRTYSSIDKICVELAHGSLKRLILTSVAVVTFDAAKKLDTSWEHVRALSQPSSGPSDGSTTVRLAVNMDVAAVTPVAA